MSGKPTHGGTASRPSWTAPPGATSPPQQAEGPLVVTGRLRTDRWETPEGEKRSKMVMDADEVGASMTFATVTITRTTRSGDRPKETAPDDPWTTATPTRPTPPTTNPPQDPPF